MVDMKFREPLFDESTPFRFDHIAHEESLTNPLLQGIGKILNLLGRTQG
jgi:hypothetical protein